MFSLHGQFDKCAAAVHTVISSKQLLQLSHQLIFIFKNWCQFSTGYTKKTLTLFLIFFLVFFNFFPFSFSFSKARLEIFRRWRNERMGEKLGFYVIVLGFSIGYGSDSLGINFKPIYLFSFFLFSHDPQSLSTLYF